MLVDVMCAPGSSPSRTTGSAELFFKKGSSICYSQKIPLAQTTASYLCHMDAATLAVSVLQLAKSFSSFIKTTGTYLSCSPSAPHITSKLELNLQRADCERQRGRWRSAPLPVCVLACCYWGSPGSSVRDLTLCSTASQQTAAEPLCSSSSACITSLRRGWQILP